MNPDGRKTMSIKAILQKKQFNIKDIEKLARIIFKNSGSLIIDEGYLIEVSNISGEVEGYEKDILEIMYLTPNGITEFYYLLKIWQHPKGKVFSVSWSDFNDLDIFNFKRGYWLSNLLIIGK